MEVEMKMQRRCDALRIIGWLGSAGGSLAYQGLLLVVLCVHKEAEWSAGFQLNCLLALLFFYHLIYT